MTAEWLVKAMGGKGNIVMLTGVPGTSVDTQRTAAAMAVFAKYPDIHIVASAVGMWSQAVARTELTKILATHPWNTIDGLWLQVGCYTAASMEAEAGIPDEKMIPCAGEGSNGHRVQMLAKGTAVDGAHDTYRPMGYPSISYASPPYSGALALKRVVDILDGKDVPHLIKSAAAGLHQRDQQALRRRHLEGDGGRLQRVRAVADQESGLVCGHLFARYAGNRRAGGAGRQAGNVATEGAGPVRGPGPAPFALQSMTMPAAAAIRRPRCARPSAPRSPSMMPVSKSSLGRCTRCSARTVPANRPW